VVLLGLVQLVFIANLVWTLARGRRVADNPWRATTLEWTTTSPPPENFETLPQVRRGPYDYSVPGAVEDFVAQDRA
jgi:cytochrome c oxidase subunit 1